MLGILCGLQSEAKIADRIPNVVVGCSEARPDRAAELVRHMARTGATRLISFGLAGALAPEMRAGDLVLGATAVCAHGAWEADGAWIQRMMNELTDYQCTPVYGSDKMMTTPAMKRACLTRTGCMIVDMESHIVAEIANRAGIPFNIVRAVADTSDMALPPAAQVPLGPDGCVDLRGVFASIRQQPAQVGELIRLARFSHAAHQSLKRAVAVMKQMGE